MTTSNILKQVQTYQLSSLALLTNQNCFIGTANTQFKDFNRLEANYGDSVSFDLPPRFVTNPSLDAQFETVEQRVHSLQVNRAENVAYEFTNQEFIFNVEDYMNRFGRAAVAELGSSIEADVARNTLSAYRFYGDGVNPINSYGQLASALAYFRNWGATKSDTIGYLDDMSVASIINTGLNQFVLDRNQTIANSWQLGSFSNARWCQSNLLPIHLAGQVGEKGKTLNFEALSEDGRQITFSGAAKNDASAIRQNDLLGFQTDVRYLTFIGHKPSANRVQIRATADAASDGDGKVIVTCDPALSVTEGRNRNLTRALTKSDTATVLPSHRRGLICAGKALYLAMPKLADQYPFPTGNAIDPDTGVSMRMYYGSTFGQNQRGFVNDVIWGSTLVPEYAMALIFPL